MRTLVDHGRVLMQLVSYLGQAVLLCPKALGYQIYMIMPIFVQEIHRGLVGRFFQMAELLHITHTFVTHEACAAIVQIAS